jgi:hypothetical protein
VTDRAGPRGVAGWWFAAAPPERLAALRILFGLYAAWDLAVRLPMLVGYGRFAASEFHPVGVVALVVDAPVPPALHEALVWATLLLALPVVVGWRYAVTAPAFALLQLWVLSYRNSWAMPFHTENLQVLHALVLAAAPAADAWSLDARRRRARGGAPAAPAGRYGWALRAAAAITVATYLLAGIAKLRIAGGDWLDGEQLRNQVAYDNLRRVTFGLRPAELAMPLLRHPELFAALAWMTMVVELGAPLALLHRRAAAAWAAAAWGFHVGVLLLMKILFPYPLAGLAYAPLFPLERPVGWAGRALAGAARRVRRRGRAP